MRHARRFPVVAPALLVGALAIAACSSGGSLQNAGNTTIAPATTVASTDTAAPGDTASADTESDDTSAPGDTAAADTEPASTEAPSTTVATPLADLPGCPTDALDAVTSPVEITFWHGITADNEKVLTSLTDTYNASQDKVHVTLQNQGGYEQALDKYLQSGQDSRPELLQAPEYTVQVLRDTDSFVPVQACEESDGYDTAAILPGTINAYSTGGVQWSMPFNVSNPVLYYNKKVFAAAGLDPEQPPTTLDDILAASKAIVESGAAKYGLVVDTDFDGGGGWYIEQWFAKAKEFYANNDNGRSAPPTQVLFDGATGVELYSFLQAAVQSGYVYNVGDNTSGQDTFLKLADAVEPGAMTIGTSAALGTVLAAIDAGIAPLIAKEDIGVAQMPGPDGSPTVLVGGASLWIAKDKGDVQTAATWDFVKYLSSAEAQSTWSAGTGYIPIREDATEIDPLLTTYSTDPRFAVAFQSLLATPDEPTAIGALLGPQREIRVLTARALAEVLGGSDVQTSLTNAATQANNLLAEYASRNP